ncbi:MAG: hypothetical protein KIT31_06645 [Deltaproteobacteria bacterium]|nr:hypothetical protein [Deltaproteobacteria bacterium]
MSIDARAAGSSGRAPERATVRAHDVGSRLARQSANSARATAHQGMCQRNAVMTLRARSRRVADRNAVVCKM